MQIALGWAEAGYLAEALTQWNPLSNQQWWAAVDLYMGNNSRFNGGPELTSYLQRIRDNARREYDLHINNAPGHTYTYVYCDEDDLPWKNCNKGPVAYTWDALGHFWSNHLLVMCPYYFSSSLPTLANALTQTRNDLSQATNMYNTYLTKGHAMLHESFHWENTVSQPKVRTDLEGDLTLG